jgi:hypothetical protein
MIEDVVLKKRRSGLMKADMEQDAAVHHLSDPGLYN